MALVFGKITKETRCSICEEMIPEDDEAAVRFEPQGAMYLAIIAHPACLVSAQIRDLAAYFKIPIDSTGT